ncbi:MAG: DUF2155 domain-containing protein [Nitrospirae bacterium]|nr:DUF2155 domain-containing protein [Nitrospirota bacterium]
MKTFLAVLVVVIAILLSIGSCKKKEEQPVPKTPMPHGPVMEAPAGIPGHKAGGPKVTFQVVVPPEVKDKWAAVKLVVEDKKIKKTQEFTVNIGSELKVPESNLTVKIGEFLPDFKMSGNIITSASNNTNNPSVKVTIYEDGKQIFPAPGEGGWLYAKLPSIHPFQHQRFALFLKEGIKKQ